MAATKNNNSQMPSEKYIKALYKRKKIGKPFEVFYNWYVSQGNKCCYCGITGQELTLLFENGLLSTKRPTRGKHLELERKTPKGDYNNFDNLALACYWCNNAKTDTFTHEEFQQVGKAFRSIWKNRLKGTQV